MTYEQFKEQLFAYRGKMSNMDIHVRKLYDHSTEEFRAYVLRSKRLGIKRMAEIALEHDATYLQEIVVWLELNKTAKKKDIEAYLLGL